MTLSDTSEPEFDKRLWERIQSFPMDDPESSFPFSARLARDNQWTESHALAVIQEYRRFLYLIVATGRAQTPSEAVDHAWHLHLTYTRNYWNDLCRDTFGREIHHDPTRGGRSERRKFWDQYQRTLEDYERAFGERAPKDIWPPASSRFDLSTTRAIDTETHWALPKKPTRMAFAALALGGTAYGCGTFAQISDDDALFLLIFSVFLAVVVLVSRKKRGKRSADGGCGGGGCSSDSGSHKDSGCGADSGCSADSGCGGGCGGD